MWPDPAKGLFKESINKKQILTKSTVSKRYMETIYNREFGFTLDLMYLVSNLCLQLTKCLLPIYMIYINFTVSVYYQFTWYWTESDASVVHKILFDKIFKISHLNHLLNYPVSKDSQSSLGDIREFTKPRRRRRGQRRVKNEFIFYLRISRYSKVIYFVYHRQNYLKTQCETQR